jgi:nucleoid-associated protein YgaU
VAHTHPTAAAPVATKPENRGMPLRVAGALTLVVGIASGFGYATWRDMEAHGAEPTPAVTETFTAQKDEAPAATPTVERRSLIAAQQNEPAQPIAGLFQVPADDSKAPTPATSSDPFAGQSEPVAAEPVIADPMAKANAWATRNRSAEVGRIVPKRMTPKPLVPKATAAEQPINPTEFGSVDPTPAPRTLLAPGGVNEVEATEPSTFQRPITDAAPAAVIEQTQFLEDPKEQPGAAPAFPPSTIPAQPKLTPTPEGANPFAPIVPQPQPANSTVPSFDLGGTEPTPVANPAAQPILVDEAPLAAPPRRPAPVPNHFTDDFEPTPQPTSPPAFNPTQRPAVSSGLAPVTPSAPPQWNGGNAAPGENDPFAARPAAAANSGEFTGQETVHEVGAGENYWTISRKHYGMGRYFAALAEYNKNRIPRPELLKPGMKVVVPTSALLTERYPQLISGVTPPKTYAPQTADAAGGAIQQAGFAVDPQGQPVYRVSDGDTLSDIAQNHLGRSSRWVQIYGLNRDQLKNPNDLKLGMILRLPQDASGVQPAPAATTIR